MLPKTARSSPAMDILKWPALAERRREHVFQLVKKCIEGRCPQYFDGYFTFNSKIHSRATRQRDLLHLPAVKTEVAKRSFYHYRCVVFNDISLCLRINVLIYIWFIVVINTFYKVFIVYSYCN